MIKAIVAGTDLGLAHALEELGKQIGVQIKSRNVVIPNESCRETTDVFRAYYLAMLNAYKAINEAPYGDVFVGRQSALLHENNNWRHLICIQVVDRNKTAHHGAWTKPASVPLKLADMVRGSDMATHNLEKILSDHYSQNAADPYCWISGGRTRQQLFVEALLKVPAHRWQAGR